MTPPPPGLKRRTKPKAPGLNGRTLEPLLMTAARVGTFAGAAALTNASGFFYRRGDRLFFVTSRHVLLDEATGHRPDRMRIVLHVDSGDVAKTTDYDIPLYRDGMSQWRDAMDGGGAIDVAVIEIEQSALPASTALRAFGPAHLTKTAREVEIGAQILIVGYPLGFHDALHQMPVARHAIVASSFGLRFQGEGYFLTDARTHRGISGAPVVMRASSPDAAIGDLHWKLLGVHSTRLDIGSRDVRIDEALGLNCSWYADVLETLTAE